MIAAPSASSLGRRTRFVSLHMSEFFLPTIEIEINVRYDKYVER